VVDLVLRFLQALTGAAWVVLLASFIYGVIKFLMNFDDERAREEGKRFMVWTFVATAVMLMVWGIISLLTNSFFGNARFGIPMLSNPF
jgi:Mg2+ and Co2+ transporter CorA